MNPPLCRCPKFHELRGCGLYPEMRKFYDEMECVGKKKKLGRFAPVFAFGLVALTIVLAIGTASIVESWGGRI